LRIPGILDGLKLGASFPSFSSCDHKVIEGLEGAICSAEDIGMIAGVNGRCDESSSLSIGAGDCDKVSAFTKVSKPCF
jgi:hypothetical protein